MSGAAEIGSMLACLRALGAGFIDRAAVEAAPLVQAAARTTAAAGTTPTGEAWAPRKKDGGRAMKNAASHVTARAVGDVVVVELAGVDVYHQEAKSNPRQVIPKGGAGVPANISAALEKGCERAFAKTVAA